MIQLFKKKPKTLIINKEISAGIPFKWEVQIDNDSIVKLLETKTLKNKTRKIECGGPVYTDYIFVGLKEGETTINFNFVSITKEYDNKTEKYKVRVDKNNNIYLVDNGE